jgi:transcription antitermination factor NusG
MVSIAANIISTAEYPGLPAEFCEPRWYAAYTSANHEKRVALQLEQRSIEHFLPLYDSQHRWNDRLVHLQLPLFPGYVFVHLALRDRLQVLRVRGVARLVGFSGTPCALPESEVGAIRRCLTSKVGVAPHPFLTVGRRVRIVAGAFVGLEGILKRKKSNLRVVVSLELIHRSVAVDVDAADVQLLVAAERQVTCSERLGH